MKVQELMALLEECEPTSEVSIYVPDPEDDGIGFVYEISSVDRCWDHQECTGKPNAIGITVQPRVLGEEVPNADMRGGLPSE